MILNIKSLLLIIPILVISSVQNAFAAQFAVVSRTFGSTVNYYVFNRANPGSDYHAAHVTTNLTESSIYILELNSVGTANTVIARKTQFYNFLVRPIGCLSGDATTATIVANCVRNAVEAQNNKVKIQALWWTSPNSADCILGGGDPSTCLGPPNFVFDDPAVVANITSNQLMYARGVDIVQGYGMGTCGVPTVTHVDMVMPRLNATATGACQSLFAGSYSLDGRDAYDGNIVNATYVFERDDSSNVQTRVVIFRVDTVWEIVLAEATGTDSYLNFYDFDFVSNSTLERPVIPLGTPLVFVEQATNGTDCVVTFAEIPAPYPPELRLPEQITDLNYVFQRALPYYYESMQCNYHVGAYDENNQLLYPYCLELVQCGGRATFANEENPALPYAVRANPAYLDYLEGGCDTFYPVANEFRGFGTDGSNGAVYLSNVPDQGACFAPFLIPDLILENDQPNGRERYFQCFIRGGMVATVSRDVCFRPITLVRCRRGYVWFFGFCFYKWDTTTQSYANTVLGDAEKTCNSLKFKNQKGDDVVPSAFSNANYYVQTWLKNDFMFWKRQDGTYRVPVAGTACDCYDFVEGDASTRADDTSTKTKCNCQETAYPLCFYKEAEYEVIDRWVRQSTYSVQILAQGKSGDPWDGKMSGCQCYNGWTGKACNYPTCPFPTLTNNDALETFFNRCYSNKRGRCDAGDVRFCTCNLPYGPFASALPSNYSDFAEFPCACPASYLLGNQPFVVNNVSYLDSRQNFKPCGGQARGACEVDSFSNTGECVCAQRTRPDDGVTLEDAYDGNACSCPVPVIYPGRTIVQRFCNNRGTCCPFGQRVSDPTGYPEACSPFSSGCVCDNGYTGEACTCDAPVDLAAGRLNDLRVARTLSIPLANPTLVKTIRITYQSTQLAADVSNTSATCVPTNVALRLDPVVGAHINCTRFDYQQRHTFWYCDSAAQSFYAKLIVVTLAESTRNCKVEAFTDWFEPCGNRTNPTAGRFFATALNRGYQVYKELQPITFAPFGCTNR